jgi:molybdopterin-guanine dinucleotide biosynthesis protein A
MLSVVLQAGGRSTRMGQNKALMSFAGRPLVERVMERVRPAADELLIVTNEPQAYRFLGVPLIPDMRPGRGPLGGLYTALMSARHALVAVVACDMPFASAPLLVAAAGYLLQDEADVVIAEAAEGFEPMHAVYRRTACLPQIEAAIAADQWRMISWFPRVKVRKLTQEELARYDPDGLAFWNVNTPQEFARAEQRASVPPAPGTGRG